jgi:hypothetical protein
MANVKISQLPSVGTADRINDKVVLVASGATSNITVGNLASSMGVGDRIISPSDYDGNVGANEYIEFTSIGDVKAGQLVKLTQSSKTYHLIKNVDLLSNPVRVHLSGPNLENNVAIINNTFAVLNDARSIPIDVLFAGNYCISHASGTNTLIADENKTSLRWTGPTSRLVYVAAKTNVADGSASTYASINVSIDGTTSALSSDITLNSTSWKEVPDGGIVAAQNQVNFGDIVEVKLTNNGGDGDSQDLTVSMVFAVEDYI